MVNLMKNYYELSRRERDNYRTEFRNLEVNRKINILKVITLGLFILCAFVPAILFIIGGSREWVVNLIEIFKIIGSVDLFILVILTGIFNSSFRKWLINKYNIRY